MAPEDKDLFKDEDSMERADELAAKLDAAQNHDGRRLGHRIRVSS